MLGPVDLADPASVVLARSTRSVLRVIAGTTQPLTGREVARLSSLSQNGAHRVLAHLVDHGVAAAEPAGRAVLYTLNRRHLLTDGLLALLTSREELIHRLAAAVQAWAVPAVHASLFGSAARGDGGTNSDLDVLVVRRDDLDIDDPGWRAQLDDLAQQVHDWTGNRLSWLELSVREVAAALAGEEPIVAEWRRDSRHLTGPTATELLSVDQPATAHGSRGQSA